MRKNKNKKTAKKHILFMSEKAYFLKFKKEQLEKKIVRIY